ncbi:MAG TPA: protein TolQ [Deltaproteobacteria bacterium]|nr:protein TolQ [Deltaproteobacteria bacterium]HCP47050.1 protein TolQ [Deltaproteobacteria bacterium]
MRRFVVSIVLALSLSLPSWSLDEALLLPTPAVPPAGAQEAADDDDSSVADVPVSSEDLVPGGLEAASTWSLIADADLVVQGVIIVLILFSVLSWAIILQRFFLLRRAWDQSIQFLDLFWKCDSLEEAHRRLAAYPDSPVAAVFEAGFEELTKLGAQPGGSPHLDNVARALRKAASESLTRLERWIPFLASCGSAAPFIGLFGTVWGILRAFQEIGVRGTTSIAEVGPYISEALIATAVGLFAAIPAVMFFNYFATRLKVISAEINHFTYDFLNLVERHERTRTP